jgi:hypothetical protein
MRISLKTQNSRGTKIEEGASAPPHYPDGIDLWLDEQFHILAVPAAFGRLIVSCDSTSVDSFLWSFSFFGGVVIPDWLVTNQLFFYLNKEPGLSDYKILALRVVPPLDRFLESRKKATPNMAPKTSYIFPGTAGITT